MINCISSKFQIYSSKVTVKGIKRQGIDWKKICAKTMFDKGLISRIQQFLNLQWA
jgi:hypothetical protein